MTLRRAYFDLRWAVDRDVARNRRPKSIYLPFSLLTMGVADLAISNLLALPLVIVGVMLSATMLAFAIWRACRMFKASTRHGDRAYDRKDKFALSQEYRATESATKAAFCKRFERKPNSRS